MFLTQGTGDEVVLAGSNALLQEQWCAKRPMTSLWLGGVSHQDTSTAAGPAAVNWARERFAGVPPVNTCALGVPAPWSRCRIRCRVLSPRAFGLLSRTIGANGRYDRRWFRARALRGSGSGP